MTTNQTLKRDLSDPDLARPILKEIEDIAVNLNRRIQIMEVCGTHTVALRKAGIHSILPSNVVLVSGPGCPVCVTPASYIDNAVHLIQEKHARIATFGDMMKVPGSDGRTLSGFAGKGRVRMVYSPVELLEIRESGPDPVVFLGIGFETTIPTVASVFLKAHKMKLKNLYLYAAFKTVPTALKALLSDTESKIDGFLLPGHVSVIIGREAYAFLEEPGGLPGVITGFEPVDMLLGILMILRQVRSETHRVENAYPRAVREEGNQKARAVIEELLEPRDDLWRGLGKIPMSGMGLKSAFSEMDPVAVFGLPNLVDYDPPGCLCGNVIQGKSLPTDCSLFGGQCTPDHPVGPCMVSSEGTCAAHLRYGEITH
jgi:hydrogenase expression/formation protein HypD